MTRLQQSRCWQRHLFYLPLFMSATRRAGSPAETSAGLPIHQNIEKMQLKPTSGLRAWNQKGIVIAFFPCFEAQEALQGSPQGSPHLTRNLGPVTWKWVMTWIDSSPDLLFCVLATLFCICVCWLSLLFCCFCVKSMTLWTIRKPHSERLQQQTGWKEGS